MTPSTDPTTHPAGPFAGSGLPVPLQVTFAGDWHGTSVAAMWAIAEAAKAGSQVIVHTGDFGIWPGNDGRKFLHVVARELARHGLFLVFVDGNHEDFDQIDTYTHGRDGLFEVRPRLFHVRRGTRWQWGGLTWMGLGGATSLDKHRRTPHVSWWPQEALQHRDILRATLGGPVDVMVTHDCPSGVGIPGLPPESLWRPDALYEANAHRGLLRFVVDEVRPTHLFHGHFHSRYDAELGLGDGLSCQVTGLDCDGTVEANVLHVPLSQLAADSTARRAASSGA